ncbi:type II secretion system protein [Halomicroarcula sp. F13]|uniref:Type II secretion system protein n=1 Tax=Haloarcula rubra TaxID=2487747 RepID=A0AAW4PL45_9EURY|nr:type II secretion system protein [Halomicroarcula rubra]MBX0321844.1 type II secretion system protein [Halomicroarcula rubra]
MTGRPAPNELVERVTDCIGVPDGYERATRVLTLGWRAERLLAASYAVAGCCWLLGLAALSIWTGAVAVVVGTACLLVAVGAVLAGRYGVPLAAQARRIRALGAAPSLVATLVLGLTLWPSTERATAFAAAADDGLLAERLDAQRRRACGTPRDGLGRFAEQWSDELPALAAAIHHVQRAAVAPPDERATALETARRRVLDGTRDEMAAFAADLRAPATGLYAFGVLLPLALVSLLPAATAAGVPVTPSLLVVTYGLVLPSVLVVASAWLLAQRPVAFPPAVVPRSHPDVPSTPAPAVAGGVAAAAGGWVAGTFVAPGWGPPLAALGVGTGTALVIHYRPVRDVRGYVTDIEADVPDVLTAIGRRVDRGQSVEAALAAAVDVTPAPLCDRLAETLDRQQTLCVGIEEAFCGEYGTLRTVPSPRLRRAAVLLDAAADVGPPAGETITTMGEHLADLSAVERETRCDLAQVTGTLSNTAALFGPLVGGATVALAGTMGSGGPIEAVSAAVLGPVVGWYCLVLAAVLTALSTGLRRGLDRALVGYRVGLALCSATATYLAAVVGTGLLV